MLKEPRTYRNSPIQVGLVILVFVILGAFLFTTMGNADYFVLIPFAGLVGIIFLAILYSMVNKTVLSDDEITAQTILGAKSLRWSEINRVSGWGYVIKLHNFDGDVTVVPSSQLPGYKEVVECIGIKRPDLFNPLEYSEMERGWFIFASLAALVFMLIFLGVGVLFLNKPETPVVIFMQLIFIVVIAVTVYGIVFSSPQSIMLNGKFILIKYLFSEKNLLADEIASVELRFTQTRNSKNYFVSLTLPNKKSIRISGLNPSLPVVYLVLKNWHKQNFQNGLTNQQN
jgi:hypothetical protein